MTMHVLDRTDRKEASALRLFLGRDRKPTGPEGEGQSAQARAAFVRKRSAADAARRFWAFLRIDRGYRA